MSEMVERVAAILDPALYSDDPWHGKHSDCPYCKASREEVETKVREIFSAIREPDAQAIKAGKARLEALFVPDAMFFDAFQVWQAMIDAALNHAQPIEEA